MKWKGENTIYDHFWKKEKNPLYLIGNMAHTYGTWELYCELSTQGLLRTVEYCYTLRLKRGGGESAYSYSEKLISFIKRIWAKKNP